MKVLVTGGAGYIGSFMTKRLLESGNNVVVADSLERGSKDYVDKRAEFELGDLREKSFVTSIFIRHKIDCVIHFAGFTSVEESMREPGQYFENNFLTAINLLEGMSKEGMNNFIFSSTAAVYGDPLKTPISEDHPKNPTNPYGYSKLVVEGMLRWYQRTRRISFVALRYFNAAGASLDGSLGERHNPETHIIPKAISAAINNEEFVLNGNDYSTPDGTCVRDYIHVLDLVEAHILAISKLQSENGGFVYNVGASKGYSNKEVLEIIKKISGVNLRERIAPRRAGDPAVLVADSTKIKNELGFKTKHSDLETIVKTAWKWHCQKVRDNDK